MNTFESIVRALREVAVDLDRPDTIAYIDKILADPHLLNEGEESEGTYSSQERDISSKIFPKKGF